MKRLTAWQAAALFLVVFSASAARAEWSPAAEKEAREVAAKFKWKASKIERFFKSSRAELRKKLILHKMGEGNG